MANTNNSGPTLASELHSSKPVDMVDPHPPDTENPISRDRSGEALTPRFEVVIPASFPSTRNSFFLAASVEGEVLLAPTTVESLQDRVVPPAPSLGAGITLNSLHGGASRLPDNIEHAAPGCHPQAALPPSKHDHSITLTEAFVPTGSHYAHSTFVSDVGHPQRGAEYSCGNGSSVPPPNSRVATIDDRSDAVTASGWEIQTNGGSECVASIPSQRQHCKQRNSLGNGVSEPPPRPPSTTPSPPYSPPPAFPEEVEPSPMHSRPCLPRPVFGGCHDEESKEHRFDVW